MEGKSSPIVITFCTFTSHYLIIVIFVSTGDFTCLRMHQQLPFWQDASGENAGVRKCFPRDAPSNAAASAAAGTRRQTSQSCCCQVLRSPRGGTQALQALCPLRALRGRTTAAAGCQRRHFTGCCGSGTAGTCWPAGAGSHRWAASWCS